jgi:peptidoglycan/LPS O-acetylase OafA/YrhL
MGNQGARLLGADFVRASACLIVLFHHLAQRIDFRTPLGSEPMQVLSNGGGLGVGLFFVLSGFLLSIPFWRALDAGRNLPSLKVYWLRRAARILPGFWLALIVSFVLSVVVFDAKLDQWLWIRLAAGFALVSDWHWLTLFPVDVNAPLWSIGFEASSYFFLPIGFVALAFYGRALSPRGKRFAWLGVIGVTLLAHLAFYSLVKVDPIGRGWEYGPGSICISRPALRAVNSMACSRSPIGSRSCTFWWPLHSPSARRPCWPGACLITR